MDKKSKLQYFTFVTIGITPVDKNKPWSGFRIQVRIITDTVFFLKKKRCLIA
ncbi:MAG: hypothetical protein JXA91_07390 [Candidatus Thermoplasmatota archaeon]|nr:hypothetical protein [Candidatus Thermoplasmatota archaeon]